MTTPDSRPKTARIHLPSIDRIIGGVVAETHEDGDVTILWAGLRERGRPIPLDELLEIERKAGAS